MNTCRTREAAGEERQKVNLKKDVSDGPRSPQVTSAGGNRTKGHFHMRHDKLGYFRLYFWKAFNFLPPTFKLAPCNFHNKQSQYASLHNQVA